MHATRTNRYVTCFTTLALLAAAASCADDSEDTADAGAPAVAPATSTPAASTTPPASTGAPSTTAASPTDTIPDGRYERVITSADADRLGVDPAVAAEAFGDEYHVVFEVDGDRYRQLGGANPDRLEVGDEGTSAYDDQGNWVTTSESAGCPGCTATIGWTFDGDTLVLSAPPDIDDPIALMIIDGSFTRAGSGTAETITMTGFLDFVPPQVVGFLDAVDSADEPVEITADMTIGYQLSEAELLEAIAAGEVDMAFVGARAFPRFDALLAPFLVDNYELQQAVFDGAIPQAMLADLGVDGVVGIGVMPGPFRKIMGADRTVDQAADLAGTRVDTDDTPLARATFAALGATPVAGAAIDEVNAFAIQLQAIPGNGYEDDAISITANLNMWPRPLVIVMNADAYETLTPAQQAVLSEAAAAATDAATASSKAEDEEALQWICPSPMQIIQMPDAELDALGSMVEPVYADLRQDPVIAAELDAIENLKDSGVATPDTFTCE
jgi:TRAP-type C4-dicarboxylate transport system substrate-binding protein